MIVFYHANCRDGQYAALAAVQMLASQNNPCQILSYSSMKDADADQWTWVNGVPMPLNDGQNYSDRLDPMFTCHTHLESGQYSRFIPVQYGDDWTKQLAEVARLKQAVMFVDFCPSLDILKALLAVAPFVGVLDHHEAHKPTLEAASEWVAAQGAQDTFHYVFDSMASGAALAWKHLVGFLPTTVSYVQDRDLWKWSLVNSRDINAYIATKATGITKPIESYMIRDYKLALAVGSWVRATSALEIANCLSEARVMDVCGYAVPAVNMTPSNMSEALNKLLQQNPRYPFAAAYWILGDGRVKVSLRGLGAVNLNLLAQQLGGGGHPDAAGYVLPNMQGLDKGSLNGMMKRTYSTTQESDMTHLTHLTNLRHYRKEGPHGLGRNQQQFYANLGITQPAGSRYEAGRDLPTPTAILLELVASGAVSEEQLLEARQRVQAAEEQRRRAASAPAF